jgi:hypothetical protein
LIQRLHCRRWRSRRREAALAPGAGCYEQDDKRWQNESSFHKWVVQVVLDRRPNFDHGDTDRAVLAAVNYSQEKSR